MITFKQTLALSAAIFSMSLVMPANAQPSDNELCFAGPVENANLAGCTRMIDSKNLRGSNLTRVIGRRTEECIRAGVMFGAADAIDGTVGRIKGEWPRSGTPLVIATGGMAQTMATLCRSFDRVEPYLTLQGLALAHGLLAGRDRTV